MAFSRNASVLSSARDRRSLRAILVGVLGIALGITLGVTELRHVSGSAPDARNAPEYSEWGD